MACVAENPDLVPDELLQAELGLTVDDRVHTVALAGGSAEQIEPASVTITPGAFVQFVSTDWFVHEVRFEADSLDAGARAFMEGSDQMASPPLIHRDSRFVVSFDGAPAGRYPFLVEGNGRPGRGVVVLMYAGRR
jgi:plastocyanin